MVTPAVEGIDDALIQPFLCLRAKYGHIKRPWCAMYQGQQLGEIGHLEKLAMLKRLNEPGWRQPALLLVRMPPMATRTNGELGTRP